MIQKLSRKFSLTRHEVISLVVMLGFLSGGLVISRMQKTPPEPSFDYSEEDKLFRQIISGEYLQNKQEIMSGDIDSLSVVSEFDKDNLKKKKTDKLETGQTININTADLQTLCRLPGIGEKTAEKILELRNRIGTFTSLSQLLSVKGIGDKKLEQLKSYISF
ncbi:MAG: helix-hairpin-helix domain-containing protein [Ignavibacteriaceae bacterium]|nr:helix-hairpin-helix domain-containing protein [Ignavibacteriaceae bacterium]